MNDDDVAIGVKIGCLIVLLVVAGLVAYLTSKYVYHDWRCMFVSCRLLK